MATKHIMYETHGTCSKMIDVTCDENDVIQQVFFLGGCNGNLQGIRAVKETTVRSLVLLTVIFFLEGSLEKFFTFILS